MSTIYVVLAFVFVFSQRSQASFEHGFEEEFPMDHLEHEEHHEPFVAAAVPVVHAAPMVAAAPAIPYEIHEHHHHSPAEVHNLVGSFHRETGHMSDTDMLLPFKRRRLAAKAARLRKTLHKKKHLNKKKHLHKKH